MRGFVDGLLRSSKAVAWKLVVPVCAPARSLALARNDAGSLSRALSARTSMSSCARMQGAETWTRQRRSSVTLMPSMPTSNWPAWIDSIMTSQLLTRQVRSTCHFVAAVVFPPDALAGAGSSWLTGAKAVSRPCLTTFTVKSCRPSARTGRPPVLRRCEGAPRRRVRGVDVQPPLGQSRAPVLSCRPRRRSCCALFVARKFHSRWPTPAA